MIQTKFSSRTFVRDKTRQEKYQHLEGSQYFSVFVLSVTLKLSSDTRYAGQMRNSETFVCPNF